MRMRKPQNDIPISEGTGFMVADGPYKRFLSETAEVKMVRNPAVFRATALSWIFRRAHVTITRLSMRRTRIATS